MNGTFNSRPHEEADEILKLTIVKSLTFNSRPHEEADNFTQFLESTA